MVMCGITGFIDFSTVSSREQLHRMASTLNHRGPDDMGDVLIEDDCGLVGLAQTRLAVIDISSGMQPMRYRHFTLVFNGEIYNHSEIRRALQEIGHRFSTKSDTEVILHAFEEWGDEAVNRFIGMFAFALYDSQRKRVFMARDRAGVKPLYYYFKNDLFLFGSELKAFHKHSSFRPIVDTSSVSKFFSLGYIPAPFSIFCDTHKLLPGHTLTVDLSKRSIKIEQYWSVTSYYIREKLKLDYQEAKQEVHRLLNSAFGYRMVSDVPVGVFLSGGYDSTAVAAILQGGTSKKLRTFTVGFESANNEAPYAKETAAYLGTDHTEFSCTERDAAEIIPNLPYWFDEPFADQSAIPTVLLSRLSRKYVTVALSADGGDEVFSGYTRYRELQRRIRLLETLPKSLRRSVKRLISLGSQAIPDTPGGLRYILEGLGSSLYADNEKQAIALYMNTVSMPRRLESSLLKEFDAYNFCDRAHEGKFYNGVEQAMEIDFRSYLPDDILTKVDRSTMSASLEGREPFLDHRLVEFVAMLPYEYKVRGEIGKRILKDIVHEYVPAEMLNRPKAGFSVPVFSWLRGDLSFLIEDFLSEQSLEASGLFAPTAIEYVRQFKAGRLYYRPLIWRLLMFQMWFRFWIK